MNMFANDEGKFLFDGAFGDINALTSNEWDLKNVAFPLPNDA